MKRLIHAITREITQIYYLLARPFSEDLFFFFSLWIAVSSADFYYWSISRNLLFGAYMALHGFLEVYAISLICILFTNKKRRILFVVFWLLGFANLCVDTGVYNIMDFGFTEDMVAIVMGTNPGETADFLKMYINHEMVLFVLIVTFLCIVTGMLLYKNRKRIPALISVFAVISIIVGSAAICVVQSQKWGSVFLGKLYLLAKYEPTRDLREYKHDCSLDHRSSSPDNIVLIIGESLSKSHMGLYGYHRNTSPLLQDEVDRMRLYCFDHMQSSGVVTTASFKYMMTTLGRNDVEDDWYSRYTLFDIATAAGYRTTWISNQSSAGVYDNVVARFAELADTVIWCGQQFMGGSKHDLDDVLLPEVHRAIESNRDSCSLYIIHLLGSHEDFHSRYPDSYSQFKPKDYVEAIENQRELLSAYDNSVLFNDFVVDSLLRQFSSKEAVVLYLSDHALDLYQSSDDYIGHARASVPKSVEAGRDIPFLVYMSDLYRERFPEVELRISKTVHNNYLSEDLIYIVMDLMGVEFSDRNLSDHKQSLFKIFE